jgi:hypothetical protein
MAKSKDLSLDMTADPSEFTEAVEEFSKRRVISKAEADSLEAYARRRAWWIAGVAQMDVANDAHQSLIAAMRDGVKFEDWKKTAGAAIEAEWGRKDSPRLLLIYRNATSQAYNAGRLEQMEQPHVVAVRPYKMLDVVQDSRTSPTCKQYTNPEVVLPWDDPFWLTHSPPLHHGCRSGIRSLRRGPAERQGVTKPEDLPQLPIPEGWGYHPSTTAPHMPSERKFPPAVELQLENARKGIAESQRKATAIPKKLPIETKDAALIRKFSPITSARSEPNYHELALAQRAALNELPEKLSEKQAKALLTTIGSDLTVEVAMRHPRLVAALGDRLHVFDLEDPKVVKALENLAKVDPEIIHAAMHAEGALGFDGVWIGSRDVTSMDGMSKLAGLSPRGYSAGQTWKDVAGLADNRDVVVNAALARNATPIHEMGHTIARRCKLDGVTLEMSEALREHHRRLYPKLPAYFQQGGPGGAAGADEMFAESFATLTLTDIDLMFTSDYDAEYLTWLKATLAQLKK